MSDKFLMLMKDMKFSTPQAINMTEVLYQHLHALLVGLTLVTLTLVASRFFKRLETPAKTTSGEHLLGTFNLLFVLLGMTSTISLIANDVVRAFAILAALTLIRFRVNLNQKSLSASMLFAVILGGACGVGEIAFAWLILGFFTVALAIVVSVVRFKSTSSEPETLPVAASPPPVSPPVSAVQQS